MKSRPAIKPVVGGGREDNIGKLLANAAAEIRKHMAAVDTMDADSVRRDLEARRHDAAIGNWWVKVLEWLSRLKIKPAVWCQNEKLGDLTKFKNRKQLFANWSIYETERRKAGATPYRGLAYALLLIRCAKRATKGEASPFRSPDVTEDGRLDVTRAEILCGDALRVLRGLSAKTFQTCVTSPPYFGAIRDFGHAEQIGHEDTLQAYIAKLIAVFREVHRVLTDDGILWIVIGDTFGRPHGGNWDRTSGTSRKSTVSVGTEYSAAGKAKQPMGVPSELTRALKADGWLHRDEVIWYKSAIRPESVKDRPSRSHDYVLMFVKREKYYANFDAIAEVSTAPEHKPGNSPRPGVIRRESVGDYLREWGDGETRHSRSVWSGPAQRYHGPHPATFPPWLPAKCVLASCPPDRECTVLDPFSGAGTTAMVALQLGHRAVGIELNPAYVEESKARLAAAPAEFPLQNEKGVQPHMLRLKNSVANGLRWEDRFNRLAADPAVLADIQREVADAIPVDEVTLSVLSPTLKTTTVGKARLYLGDWQDVVGGLDPAQFDLIFGDLPFGMTRLRWDQPINLVAYFRQAVRLIKPTGIILMCATEPFTSEVVHICRELFRFRWVWFDDGPFENHLHTAHHPLKIGQDVLVFSPSGTEFTFNPERVPLEKTYRASIPHILSAIHLRRPVMRIQEPRQYDFGHPSNLLFFPTLAEDRQMETQKPMAMVEYFIRTYSRPGDLVGDFFLGSGTTAIAALRHGCRFIGGDREAKQFNPAVERIQRSLRADSKTRTAAD